MVQQLSLHSAIDDNSYELAVSTLSSLAGNPPVLFSNFTAMCKPNPTYIIEKVNSKNQLVEQNRIKLCKEVPMELLPRKNTLNHSLLKEYTDDSLGIDPRYFRTILYGEEQDNMDIDDGKKETYSWSLSTSDIPSAGGNRKVSMQSITESVILSSGGSSSSIASFLLELGYVIEYQYFTLGVRFYFANGICLDLYKIWHLKEDITSQITKGGFLIKAYVNVAKSIDLENINNGISSLLGLQRELNGYIDLEVPDRKAMDSRVDHMNDI